MPKFKVAVHWQEQEVLQQNAETLEIAIAKVISIHNDSGEVPAFGNVVEGSFKVDMATTRALNKEAESVAAYVKKTTLYDWPTSQNCMDCKHGEPVQFVNESDLVATCLCLVACTENDGVDCP